MKIIIMSENSCFNTVISKSIKVKELLNYLKKSFPDLIKTDSIFMDEKGILSEEDMIVLNQEVKTLFIMQKLIKKLS